MKKKLDYKDFKFNHINFNDRERNNFLDWSSGRDPEKYDSLSHHLDANNKISISSDQNTGAVMVTVTPRNTKLPVYGQIYMFKHNDWEKAIDLSLFYFSETLQNGEVNPDPVDDLDW